MSARATDRSTRSLSRSRSPASASNDGAIAAALSGEADDDDRHHRAEPPPPTPPAGAAAATAPAPPPPVANTGSVSTLAGSSSTSSSSPSSSLSSSATSTPAPTLITVPRLRWALSVLGGEAIDPALQHQRQLHIDAITSLANGSDIQSVFQQLGPIPYLSLDPGVPATTVQPASTGSSSSSSSSSSSLSLASSSSTRHRDRTSGGSHKHEPRRHSSSHRHHHRSRERSGRSRSRSPRSSRERSSSRSRSRSRHHHHDRHRRSRSPSPPPPVLHTPDPCAPQFKPLSDKVVSDVLKGKFVPIHDLVRQPQATTTTTNTDIRLTADVTITTSPRVQQRGVTCPDDWVETYLSSVLPILAHKAERATSLTEAKAAATLLQQHITYALSAVVMFRRAPFPFPACLRYLESHRQDCTIRSTDIGAPDLTKLTTLTQQSVADAARAATTAAAAPTASATPRGNSNRGSTHTPHKQSAAAAAGICGNHNSFVGCTKPPGTCPYKHICLECRATDHIKPACPRFISKPKQQQQQQPSTTAAPSAGGTKHA